MKIVFLVAWKGFDTVFRPLCTENIIKLLVEKK